MGSSAFRGSFGAPFSALWLGMHLARNGWRYLLVVALNLSLVVMLFCANALYTTFLTSLALQQQLHAQPSGGVNVDVTVTHTHISSSDQRQEDQAVTTLARSTLAAFAPTPPTGFLTVAPLLLGGVNDVGPGAFTMVQFEAYDNAQLLPHITLVAGTSAQASDDPHLPNVLITQQMAQVDSVRPGDILSVRGGAFFDAPELTVRVAGVWVPRDATDPFWNGRSFRSEPIHDTDPFVFVVLAPKDALAPLLDGAQAITTQHWIFQTQTRTITPSSVEDIDKRLIDFRSGLAVALSGHSGIVGMRTITGLDTLLNTVLRQRQQFALSTESVGVLALGAALLILVLVTQLFVERERGLLATIRSRGASATQIIGAYLLLTAFVGCLSAFVGVALMTQFAPDLFLRFVATSAAQGAGATTGYLASQIDLLALIAPAAACVLVAVAISGWTAFNALRSNVRAIALAAGAEHTQPFWQRLKLDIFLALLCVVGYLDLAYYHGADALPSGVNGAPSPLLVAAPLMLLVAATLLLLRIFPLTARLWASLASRGRGATGLLASVRLTRGQTQVALQPLLLMLAIGVLALTVTYQVSAQQIAAAQSAYQVGADVRLIERATEAPQGDALIRSRLARLSSLVAATSAYRGVSHSSAFWNVVSVPQDAVDTLAIDPQTFDNVTGAMSWRSPYAKTSLADLMAAMASHERRAAASAAPIGSQANPIWAIVSQRFAQIHDRKLGQVVKLLLPDNVTQFTYFTVGAIVSDFPTMHTPGASGSFMITDEHSLFTAIGLQNEQRNVSPGPNEYWLRGGADLPSAVEGQAGPLDVDRLVVRQRMEADLLAVPSLVGLRTLMVFGAAAIGLLTALATTMQTALDTQQREPELQAMRALGVSKGQLEASLICERLFTALFGVVGGALTGWALAATTLPYLPMPGEAPGRLPALSGALLLPLAAAVGLLVGLLALHGVLVSVRAARRPINLRLLGADA